MANQYYRLPQTFRTKRGIIVEPYRSPIKETMGKCAKWIASRSCYVASTASLLYGAAKVAYYGLEKTSFIRGDIPLPPSEKMFVVGCVALGATVAFAALGAALDSRRPDAKKDAPRYPATAGQKLFANTGAFNR